MLSPFSRFLPEGKITRGLFTRKEKRSVDGWRLGINDGEFNGGNCKVYEKFPYSARFFVVPFSGSASSPSAAGLIIRINIERIEYHGNSIFPSRAGWGGRKKKKKKEGNRKSSLAKVVFSISNNGI